METIIEQYEQTTTNPNRNPHSTRDLQLKYDQLKIIALPHFISFRFGVTFRHEIKREDEILMTINVVLINWYYFPRISRQKSNTPGLFQLNIHLFEKPSPNQLCYLWRYRILQWKRHNRTYVSCLLVNTLRFKSIFMKSELILNKKKEKMKQNSFFVRLVHR